MARAAGTLIERGPGLGPTVERVRELAGKVVKVGLVGELGAASKATRDGAEPGTTVAEVAAAHEFGTGSLPERSFLRSTLREHQEEFVGRLRAAAHQVADQGVDPTAALSLVGEAAKAAVQRKIVQGPFVPNSPATIARKKSSRPLIDTGQMRQSISYEVKPRKGARRGGA